MIALLTLMLGCAETDVIPYHFDGPVAAAVLPGGASVFPDPTGYVANSRSGEILQLDLKEGRLLSDDAAASFLRASPLATGRSRILSDLVVTGDAGSVTIWAADAGFKQLLRVPYVLSVDAGGGPIEAEPVATVPEFNDVDGSGDSPTLTDVTLRPGHTTTETWSIEFDGTRWWARGSRSGQQTREPVAGEVYETDEFEIQFTLTGSATAGDYFTIDTDTGIDEITPGAPILGLLAQGGDVFVSLASSPGRVDVYDALTGGVRGSVVLPEGSQPGRLAAAPDGRIFVADASIATAWVLRFDRSRDPATVPVESVPTAGPLIDVAWQGGEAADGTPFDHLFVAPVAALRVDVYDLAASAWIDPNPVTPEVEGIFIGAPVSGLAASTDTVRLQPLDVWGARPRVPTVSVATSDGFVFQVEGPTGCLATDARGPHAPNPSYDANTAYAVLDDQGAPSDVTLWIDEVTGAQVIPSSCGGVARSELWTITYDSAALSWRVEGSLSGVQLNPAYEDERYLSDDGAISFLLSPGPNPPTDGDSFELAMSSGLLAFGGTDDNRDGAVDLAWEFPGRPVGYSVTAGPTGGGWDEVNRKEYMLLPVINGDIIARLDLDSGQSEERWQ